MVERGKCDRELRRIGTEVLVSLINSWKCHICGRERPDEKISVLTKPVIIKGQACGEQNIRYCNDRPECIEGAKEFSFFKEGKGTHG